MLQISYEIGHCDMQLYHSTTQQSFPVAGAIVSIFVPNANINMIEFIKDIKQWERSEVESLFWREIINNNYDQEDEGIQTP